MCVGGIGASWLQLGVGGLAHTQRAAPGEQVTQACPAAVDPRLASRLGLWGLVCIPQLLLLRDFWLHRVLGVILGQVLGSTPAF